MSKFRTLLILLAVTLAFGSLYGVAAPATAQSASLITVMTSDTLGKYLAGENGMTLYSFPPDGINESNCYDKCAEAWPPLIVDSADKITADASIPGTFGTATRKDGKLQVSYNGMPLYYWARDAKAGDTTGNRVGRNWWVVPPATVYAATNPKLGWVLAGSTGMTLYTFKKDTPDTSNCYDQCATNWPPLTVKSEADVVPGINLLGKLGTTTRKDGAIQLTYNGWPLYYWKDDKALGDANGEGVGDVWYSVPVETVGVASSADMGDHLVSWDGMTLYTFAKDSAGMSACSGDCVKNWKPYTVRAIDRLAAGTGVMGKLGTITREDDKSLQVTYNDMPLYFFAKDVKPGDASGVSDVWPLAKP
ncbi:MAG: hypothetical protein KF716_23820 [Anaerolineae bacterium]|nr:hypothetical protein [Anaerolineae bacterium]